LALRYIRSDESREQPKRLDATDEDAERLEKPLLV
jgi:hypothetical protein